MLRKYVLGNSSQSKKLKGNLPIGQLVSHMYHYSLFNLSDQLHFLQQKQIVISFLAGVGSCRGKHMVMAQLSSLLIHIRLVPTVIGCLFQVTKRLRVIIDDITLLVPSKECFM